MKKFFLFLIVLAMSVVLYGCGGAPTKEEVASSLKQVPNFKDVIFFASTGSNPVNNPYWLRIKVTDPKISGKVYDSSCFAIFTTSNNEMAEMYIAFLDGTRPPRIISIHKLK